MPMSTQHLSLTRLKAAWIKSSTFLGIYLTNLWAAISMIWGNLSVYTSSYFYVRVKDSGSIQTPWTASFFFLSWAFGMMIAKSIYDRTGKRPACAIGILLVNAGILFSYFTVQHSVMMLAISLGFVEGLGSGIISSVTMVSAVEWTDKYFGLATASCAASVSVGAVMSNQMITMYINPDNLLPDKFNGQVRYFSLPEVIDRVPSFFLFFGTASIVVNFIGLVLLRNKKDYPNKVHPKLLEEGDLDSKSLRDGHFGEGYSSHDTLSLSGKSCPELNQGDHQKAGTYSSKKDINHDHKFAFPDHSPRQMLKTCRFYALALVIMFSDLTYLSITTYYKAFGLIYITDDHFMTNIGTALVATIAFFSCLSGIVTDKLGLKPTLIWSASFLTIISAFYYFIPMLDKWTFGVVTVLYGGLMYFNYSLFYVTALKFFGQAYFSTNYGLATTGGILISIVSPPAIDYVLKFWGWFSLFFMLGVVNGISLILVVVGFPDI